MIRGLCLVAVLSGLIPAQAPCAPADPYEDLLGASEDEADFLDLLNRLDAAVQRPVNLLDASRDQILALPWVSPWLADRIIQARKEGKLDSIDDLRSIGVSARLVDLLRPFAYVRRPEKAARPLRTSHRARVVSVPASGTFVGQDIYARSDLDYGGWSGGLAIEKDRDERRLNDFQAFYLSKDWASASVVAGDFTLTSGHGLVFSNAYGESPTTVSPWRFSQGKSGIAPYTSTDENFMLEGAGVRLEARRFHLVLAGSRSRFDAVLDSEGRVKSIGTTGKHATASELASKDLLTERLVGGLARYGGGRASVGLSVAYSTYNRAFAPGKLEAISRRGHAVGGLDARLEAGQMVVFAEGALAGGGAGAVLGGLASHRQASEFLLLGRAYGRRYVSLHARPFAFYSGYATGERGLLCRVELKPVANAAVALGSDLHTRAEAEAPTDVSGSETFLDLDIDLGAWTVSAGEKLARSRQPASAGGTTRSRSRLRSRLGLEYEPSRTWSVSLRYESLDAVSEEAARLTRSDSDVLRLDVAVDLWKGVDIKAGFYTFSVDDYDSRLYQYEAGLPYYPSFQVLQNGGSRWYAVISLERPHLGKVAAKFARTLYCNEERSEFMASYALRM